MASMRGYLEQCKGKKVEVSDDGSKFSIKKFRFANDPEHQYDVITEVHDDVFVVVHYWSTDRGNPWVRVIKIKAVVDIDLAILK